jgi:hypothetical protein
MARNNNVPHYHYRTEEDIRNVIRYVLCGNENDKPLFSFSRGYHSLYNNPNEIANEVIYNQMLFHKESGIRIRHEFLTITYDELSPVYSIDQIKDIAWRFADYYLGNGFRVAAGIFTQLEAYCIHYAIDTVCFVDGSKYRYNQDHILNEQEYCARSVVASVTGKTINNPYDFQKLQYYV